MKTKTSDREMNIVTPIFAGESIHPPHSRIPRSILPMAGGLSFALVRRMFRFRRYREMETLPRLYLTNIAAYFHPRLGPTQICVPVFPQIPIVKTRNLKTENSGEMGGESRSGAADLSAWPSV